MEWVQILRSAVRYMEDHIREPITLTDVADHLLVSPMYLQRGFEVITGYTVARYLRYRRLYLAALDLAAGQGKVIDVACRYGFDTPESFTKAFSRFHGATPSQIKADHSRIKVFLPLHITLSVQGGKTVEYSIQKRGAFQMIGFCREIPYDEGYGQCPRFWEEFSEDYLEPLFSGKEPETELERAVRDHRIGEYGVCVDDSERSDAFRYLIAGEYTGGPVPKGLTLYKFPALDWAVFPCRGPMPAALQAVNTQIVQEWLPGNPDYEIAMAFTVEWYSRGDIGGPGYESAIWIPVKKKDAKR